MQTIDLEKLDYRAIHQQLSRVYELPTEEQKTTRAALQRAYTEKMQEALRQFIGSERFVQMGRPFQRFLYTEGVAFLAKETRSYWLLDMIASYYPKYRGEPFLSAHLKAQDGAGQFSLKVDEKVIARQRIPFSDFPMTEIELWVAENELKGYTILLPSEY